jgi:predicted pyridoxine 5'-phosphate oxidase superfamily flavin-nucleotide-binding protein
MGIDMQYEYHPGELEVQWRARVRESAKRLAGSIHRVVPQIAKAFLEERRLVVLATADANNRPWASVLSGSPGFARAINDQTIRIEATTAPGDPLAMNLRTGAFVGLIAPDLSARRRIRINGRLETDTDGAILIHVDQAYSNCPKYIQRRDDGRPVVEIPRRLVQLSTSLHSHQRDWIRRADTFFLATLNPGEGADASHRGGMPGFVKVQGQELIWPDYAGNSMFNSLGNIARHQWAGIVVPDFDNGSTLQLTGRATIDWNPEHSASMPGAERLVRLAVEEIVEIEGVFPADLRLVEYSPFNPREDATAS